VVVCERGAVEFNDAELEMKGRNIANFGLRSADSFDERHESKIEKCSMLRNRYFSNF